jgi:hypothetical protein
LSNSLSPFVGQLLIKWPIAKSKNAINTNMFHNGHVIY